MPDTNKKGQPFYARPNEKVGAGFFVFRRGEMANRIKPGPLPFEHASLEQAYAEATRLAKANPKNKYVILQQMIAIEGPK